MDIYIYRYYFIYKHIDMDIDASGQTRLGPKFQQGFPCSNEASGAF